MLHVSMQLQVRPCLPPLCLWCWIWFDQVAVERVDGPAASVRVEGPSTPCLWMAVFSPSLALGGRDRAAYVVNGACRLLLWQATHVRRAHHSTFHRPHSMWQLALPCGCCRPLGACCLLLCVLLVAASP